MAFLSAIRVGITQGIFCTLTSLTCISVSIPADALSFGIYNFDGDVLTPSSVASGVSLSDFSYTGIGNSEFVIENSGKAYSSTAWNVTTINANTRYFSFTITPNSGNQITIAQLIFDHRSSNTGPVNFIIRSSFDNFATDIVSGITGVNSGILFTSPLSLSGLNNITNAIEFRIYGYNGTNTLGRWRLDNVQLQGDISAIPFEFSPTLGIFAVGSYWGIKKVKERLLPKKI